VSRLKERHAEVSLQCICELFGYSRQAYYKSLKRNDEGVLDDCRILLHVGDIRKLMPRLGTRKLHYMLQKRDIRVSRDRLFDILRENNLLVKRRKKYTVTTNSKHWMKKYPNLIRGFNFDKPNHLWVSDITYIPIRDTHAYLSLITDAFSRKILGYCLSQSLASEGSLKALQLALSDNNTNLHGLIHHSDRGIQYCCKEYVELLKTNHIRISMTENGDPYENALAERVNGILKDEWLSLEQFSSFQQAKNRISQVIKIYNELRPHLSCGMKTPTQKHNQK
jgi:transposase InsO family protein